MAESGLIITRLFDVTTVTFRDTSILDGAVVEAIGKELYELVDSQALRKLTLDFTAVRFLSSSMLGVLIQLHKKSQAIKGRLVICGLKPELKKVFKIMRLEKVLQFADDEAEAMRLLNARKQS